MSTSAEIGRSPIASSRRFSQSGLGPFLRPRMWRPRNSGHALWSVELDADRRYEFAGDRRLIERRQRADPGGGKVAREAAHAEAIGAVRASP